jgi:hypothetical protein
VRSPQEFVVCEPDCAAATGVEEPHLHKRFGADYDEYRRNVPRWIPRITAWEPSPTGSAVYTQ